MNTIPLDERFPVDKNSGLNFRKLPLMDETAFPE